MVKFFFKYLIFFLFIPVFITLTLDYFFGYFFEKKNPEKEYRVFHPIYHHALKPNFNSDKAKYLDITYEICTDSRGFRFDCESKELKKYDVAFIGDSFTEGVPLPYEASFVDLIDKATDLNVVNLGVSSYSPVIYYYKVKNLLEKTNLYFEHLIVFIDISDIQNETMWKDCGGYVCEELLLGSTPFLVKLKTKLADSFPLHYKSYFKIKTIFSERPTHFVTPGLTILDYNYELSAWTYNSKVGGYGKGGAAKGIQTAVTNIEKLYHVLEKNKIKLSIAVYPWPGQIMHDVVNSKQVNIWFNFCKGKCFKFINYFPYFFNYAEKFGKKETIEQFYLKNDFHFNEKGNEMIASKFILNFN